MRKKDFIYSDSSEPHRIRTKQILKQHPDVRKLIGKNPNTFWFILLLVGLQVAGAFYLADKPWWLLLVAAYFVGAFIDHVGLCPQPSRGKSIGQIYQLI